MSFLPKLSYKFVMIEVKITGFLKKLDKPIWKFVRKIKKKKTEMIKKNLRKNNKVV